MLTNSGPRAPLGTETNWPKNSAGGCGCPSPECGWGTTGEAIFHYRFSSSGFCYHWAGEWPLSLEEGPASRPLGSLSKQN